MTEPRDNYGTYGSVPSTQSQGVSDAHVSSQANAQEMGAGVGEAISGLGKEVGAVADQYFKTTSEAKVNDDYANKYVPAAANLRQQFDMLRGQDKIGGYDGYVSGLQQLNKQFVSSQPSTYGQQAMSGLVNKHIAGEIFGAKSELVASQKEFSDKARFDMLSANNQIAANNYNNPELVKSVEQQNDNHILLQHIDEGQDPNNPENQSLISSSQNANKSDMATGMIQTAIGAGDVDTANQIRTNYSNVIPGYLKQSIDSTLHVANIQQDSQSTVQSLTTGGAVPEFTGAPPSHIQAMVADTAKSNEVDPNNALTVLRIESADGTNTGERGTLGQDRESAGKPIEDQAKALCNNLKIANNKATEALGRPANPWEGYMVYQQGVGGGPALLKAAQDNPNAKAVDILAPLYKNPKDAAAAISNNGGNVAMTASDFADHIKQVYTDSEARAKCSFGNAATPGDAIQAPHQTPGVTIQPAASPTQALMNFDKKAPQLLANINAIPNDEVRDGVMKQYNKERQKYTDAASAYQTVLVNQAGQLAADPKFTSMDQIPAELHASLAVDHPQTLDYLERRAQYNSERGSGMVTKDMREYGKGFYDLFNAVHAPADDPNRISSIGGLQKHIGKDGDLTIAGYDKLSKELEGKSTPEGDAEGIMKKQFLKNAKEQISNENIGLNIQDPKGEEMYQKFLTQVLPAYDAARAQGKSAIDLLNPDSKDYVGNSIGQFKRALPQQVADTVIAQPSAWQGFKTSVQNMGNTPILPGLKNIADSILGEEVTPESLRQAVLNGKMTRAQGEAEALKRGYIKTSQASTTAQVPIAQ